MTCRICDGTGEDGICHECLQEWWENDCGTKELQAEIDRLRADRQALLDAAEKTAELVMRLGKQIVDQQKAIVDKLPKTADGVPVTPHMELWEPPASYAPERGAQRVCVNPGMFNSDIMDYFTKYYSSREAAEAGGGEYG